MKTYYGNLLFAAPNSGSGKTTVVLGILSALRARNISIQPYKVGPDYIDTAYHQTICEKPAINLDAFLLNDQQLQTTFEKYNHAQIAIIEGVMGLYDGIGTTSDASTASVAQAIHAPIILVIDARGMAASIAALIQGFQNYGKAPICGIILNRIRSQSHFELLKNIIERDTCLPCLGYLPYDETIEIPSRHLGILPPQELKNFKTILKKIQLSIEQNVDIDLLLNIACNHNQPINYIQKNVPFHIPCSIAVGLDPSMSFYYHDNLELLKESGALLHFFEPMHDTTLPPCDGLYLGGGFPEIFAEQLEKNISMRSAIKQAAEQGLPIYAECGGYMYLTNAITTQQQIRHAMCNVFSDVSCIIQKRLNPQFGYAKTMLLQNTPIGQRGFCYKNHEFHHSVMHSNTNPVYSSKKMSTGKTWTGGSLYKNCFGTYAHTLFRSNLHMLQSFLLYCQKYKMS